MDGEEKEIVRKRINEDNGSVDVRCTYVRDGEIVLEQTEFVDRKLTIAELVEQVRRFEDLGMELVDINISFKSERR